MRHVANGTGRLGMVSAALASWPHSPPLFREPVGQLPSEGSHARSSHPPTGPAGEGHCGRQPNLAPSPTLRQPLSPYYLFSPFLGFNSDGD